LGDTQHICSSVSVKL